MLLLTKEIENSVFCFREKSLHHLLQVIVIPTFILERTFINYVYYLKGGGKRLPQFLSCALSYPSCKKPNYSSNLTCPKKENDGDSWGLIKDSRWKEIVFFFLACFFVP